ncbi:MAG: hypothetical protein JOZ96_17120 [Acidobacteria bacterium]|nr:hypothetical protein [Acidobacteriota bacterium]
MATVDVLIAVDVEGAMSSQSLQNNVYLMDTNKFFGSYQEGQSELITKLRQGDRIIWSVSPIDPGTNVSISGFTGQAVGVNVTPTQNSDGSWTSLFSEAPPSPGTAIQYSVNLSFEGAQMSFDPFLVLAS